MTGNYQKQQFIVTATGRQMKDFCEIWEKLVLVKAKLDISKT